jgi:hypothetical protein
MCIIEMINTSEINKTILTFDEISLKINTGFFDECLIFPTIPDEDVCLEYNYKLREICILVFPKINHPTHRMPAIYAITFVLLLRACNINLYNQCHTLDEIWNIIRDEDMNGITWVTHDTVRFTRDEDDDDTKFICVCSHIIHELIICSANDKYILLGNTCINKTEINSLKEQVKNLYKIICDICFELKKPSYFNDAICTACSKKRECAICNLIKNTSKNNPEICGSCYKTNKNCLTTTCQKYCRKLKKVLYCNGCIAEQTRLCDIEIAEQTRLRNIEIAEQTRLLRNEKIQLYKVYIEQNIAQWRNDKLIKMPCMSCNIDINICHWSIECLKCYRQFNLNK